MEIKIKTKKAGVLIALASIFIIVFISLVFVQMIKPSIAQPYFPKEHLFVDATYLLKTDETNDSVNVTCTPYLTNIWSKESGEIEIIAYVIETKDNLAVYKNTVEIGKIAANSTAEIEMPVVLSNSSYKVDILIFESGKLTVKGTLTISAYSIYHWDEISHENKQVWSISNYVGDFIQMH